MGFKLLRWLAFGVVFALLPFCVLVCLSWAQDGKLSMPPVYAVGSRGELLILVAAVAADGLGEAVSSRNVWPVWTLLTAAFCTLSLAAAGLGYGMMQSSPGAYDAEFVFWGTAFMLMMAVVSNGGARVIVALEEGKR